MPSTSGGLWTDPNYNTQTGTTYPLGLDGALMDVKRIGNSFNPYASATPDMTIHVDAGHIFNGTTLTEVAAQNTPTFTAPVSNPRIDRVVIDRLTGTLSVVAGTENVSPTPPAIPAGKVPVAQVYLTVGMVAIGNTSITDERDLGALGLSSGAYTTVGTAATQNVGTAANNVVQLDGSARLLAIDGSQLKTFPINSRAYAAGDGTTDDTVGLNSWLAAAIAAKAPAYLSAGTYKFTAALTPISGNNIVIFGDGPTSILQYQGASTSPGDLLTIGSNSSTFSQLRLDNFVIGSTTTLTAGSAIHIIKTNNIEFNVILNGTANLYNGVRFDQCSFIDLLQSQFSCLHENIQWNDGVELHCCTAKIYGIPATLTTSIGIHVGGGCGGFYANRVMQQTNNIGCLVDTALAVQTTITGNTHTNTTLDNVVLVSGPAVITGMQISGANIPAGTYVSAWNSGTKTITLSQSATGTATGSTFTLFNGNTQLWFELGCVFDSNNSDGLYLNDSTVNPISKLVQLNGWFASSKAGNGVAVVNWSGGTLGPGYIYGTPQLVNNFGDGMRIDDAHVTIALDGTTHLHNNGSYGVDAGSAITIKSRALGVGNGGGNYGVNVTAVSW